MSKIRENFSIHNPVQARSETDWVISTWQHLLEKYSREFIQHAVHPIEQQKERILTPLKGKEPPPETKKRLKKLNRIIRGAYQAFFSMDHLAKSYIRHTSTLYYYFSGDITRLLRENSELKKDLVLFRQMWQEADDREKIWIGMIKELQARLNQATEKKRNDDH
ncbi:MAG: hypothetical protein H6559_37850 [Lewinellaceae bacterium]|nr:hypothetical protein [Lewinellaceae bacterium]